jgi:hypothetical protein
MVCIARRWLFACLVLSAAMAPNVKAAAAEDAPLCQDIAKAVANPDVAIVPEKLLAEPEGASRCLITILGSLAARVTAPETDEQTGEELLKAAGALNTIVSASKDQAKAINFIRDNDSIAFAEVLAWGARDQDTQIRLASTILLANVVDNNSICVVLDHLYDKTFLDTPHGVNGRVNLLSVVAVIAPWAYQQNYQNILRMLKTVRPAIEGNKEMAKSGELLASVCERLVFQGTYRNPNRETALPEELQACVGYEPQWATPEQLSYGASASVALDDACP